jgi:putative spermidine/putrescine transport system ATP-binding protein
LARATERGQTVAVVAQRPRGSPVNGAAIRLERCGKTFADGTCALEPVDLDFAAGETVVLLGPSGCGKTTTLRIVAGLELPDAGGRVHFDGTDVTMVPIERRNVGMVFQSYALFPNMTVAQNIAYGLKVRGLPAADRARRTGEMLAMMQIETLADRHVDQLSGGQRQRVALARALAPRPRVLLLDEPLTALDARLRDTLRVEINRLLRSLGITTVYVTHDQAEAMALGDRIVVMDHGRVAQIGTPRQIYEAPATRFVAEFIGTMNVVSGQVRAGALHCAGGRVPLRNGAADGPGDALFRPEDLQLAAPGGATDLAGRVLVSLFQGDHTRLEVDVGGARPVVARIGERRDFAAGERLWLKLSTPALFAPHG